MRKELLLVPVLLFSATALARVDWQTLDQDRDGQIDRQDVMRAPLFDQWDEDGDDVLSKAELEKHGKDVTETLGRGRATGMNADPQPWGQPLDVDGDNRVSREEYAAGLVAVYDRNGDQVVQRDEWPGEERGLLEKLRPGG